MDDTTKPTASGLASEARGVLVFVPEVRAERGPGLRVVLAALRRDLWIHLLILLVCLAGAAAYVLLTGPVYRAQVVVLPVSESSPGGLLSGLQGSGLGSVAGLAGINLGGNDDFHKESMALLTSKDFAASFLQDEHMLPILYADKWDAAQGRWRVGPSEQPTLEQALERFDREVRAVTEDRRSGLTQISMEWRDRQLAAKWANDFVARANAELRRRTLQDAQKSLKFLSAELDKTTVTGLRETLFRLMETEMRKEMMTAVREDYAFRIMDLARVPMATRPVRPRPALAFALALACALLASSWLLWSRAHQFVRDLPA